MKMVQIARPKPTFRRTDPEQVALRHELKAYTNKRLQELETAMDEYVRVGFVGPALAHLLRVPCTLGHEAA